MDEPLNREIVRRALMQEFSGCTDVFEFRHAGANAAVPLEIDVLVFEPDVADTREDEWFTNFVTAGVSSHALAGGVPHLELILVVVGHVIGENRERLARGLANLGAVLFQDRVAVSRELVLANVRLPMFDRMSHVVLSPYLAVEQLATTPPVAVLRVTPVFAREAEQLRRLGTDEALRRFAAAGFHRADPERRELDIRAAPEPTTVDELWTAIERVLGSAGLHPPVADDAVRQLQDHVSEPLPDAYVESLKRHDGVDDLAGCRILSVAEVLETRRTLVEQLQAGAFASRVPDAAIMASRVIDHTWWNAAWVPFAEEAGAILHLDLAPWRFGIEGQILRWHPDRGPLGVTYPSFITWLADRADRLKRGG